MDNEEYATTGGQETPTAHGADLDAAARAMGIARTATVRTVDELKRDARASDRAPGRRSSSPRSRVGADREAAARLRLHQAALHGGDRQPGAGHRRRSAACRSHDASREFVVDGHAAARGRAPRPHARCSTPSASRWRARSEPAARIVQRVVEAEGSGPCRRARHGARARAPANAALANGTAAHALDYDDMCFVSLAHPSAPLVSAALAAAELAGASGAALLDAYVVGFELEGRLGRAMNPRHYQRGWHCTSTLGTIGAAAAASRLLGLDARPTGHALAIAASEASGLKENFGTMVKPLHAGLAARNGVLAAQLAQGRHDRERGGDRGPAGIPRARWTASSRRSTTSSADLGDALGDSRHRDHRQAVSVVRRDAPDARRAARLCSGASASPATTSRRSKSASIRSCRRF